MRFSAILTDVEPDDLLALVVLAGSGSPPPQVLIAGEGNAAYKAQQAAAMCSALGWTSTRVLPGAPSGTAWPWEAGTPSGDSNAHVEAAVAALVAAVSADPEGALLCLKPPRELIAAAAAGTFAGMHLVMYGSFNLRCVPVEAARALLAPGCFASVTLYEQFGGSEHRSLDRVTAPRLARVLFDAPTTCAALLQLRTACAQWNAGILVDCDAAVAECDAVLSDATASAADTERAKEKRSRNAQVAELVSQHGAAQMVAADGVLAALVTRPDAFNSFRCRVTYELPDDGGYPVITPDSGAAANCWMYRGVPWAAVEDALAAAVANRAGV